MAVGHGRGGAVAGDRDGCRAGGKLQRSLHGHSFCDGSGKSAVEGVTCARRFDSFDLDRGHTDLAVAVGVVSTAHTQGNDDVFDAHFEEFLRSGAAEVLNRDIERIFDGLSADELNDVMLILTDIKRSIKRAKCIAKRYGDN